MLGIAVFHKMEMEMRTTDTKERLIKAALELFSENGYEGTSVDQIAKAVGIKTPSIYAHFKGKEELLGAVIDWSDEEYAKGMGLKEEAGKNVRTGKELKEYSLKLITFTLHNEISIRMRRLLTIEQYRNEMFAESATKHMISNIKSLFTLVFKRMMDEGTMVRCNPEIAALEFMAPVSLLIQLCDRAPDKEDEVMTTIEEHIDIFIERWINT